MRLIDADTLKRKFCGHCEGKHNGTCQEECFDLKIINSMPTVEPKKGKWISETKGKVAILDEFGDVSCSAHCSECGDWLTASDEYPCRGNYCPNCGAKMEE